MSGAGGKEGLAVRAYRLLLKCYPDVYLERFEEEMVETFARAHADCSLRGLGRGRFWLREIGGVVHNAAREKWSVRSGSGTVIRSGRDRRLRRGAAALAHGLQAASRSLRKNPRFTAGAAVLFGVGAGLATLMFSIVDSVVLEPLDIPQADRVVQIQTVGDDGERGSILTAGLFKAMVEESDVFERITGFQPWADILTTETEARTLNSLGVTADFLPLLGVRVVAGRGLEPSDFEPDAPRVALLGHAFWERHFGSDPAVVGDLLPLSTSSRADRSATIVGVLSPDFRLPPLEGERVNGPSFFGAAETPDVVSAVPAYWTAGERGMATSVIGRLRDGVTLEQARASVSALAGGLRPLAPAWMDFGGLELSPLPSLLRRHYGPVLYIFWIASGLLLLIACANVANLLTAHGLMRRREMAVRASLGADRNRLFLQLLAESGLLGMLGGLAGALIAYAGIQGLLAVFPGDVHRLASAGLDARSLGFLVVVSLVPPLAFGVLPAWQGSAIEHATILKSSYGGSVAASARVLRGLVVAQIALALVVVTGGSLLVRTYRNLASVDLGFDEDHVLTFSVSTFPGSYSKYAGEPAELTGMVLDRITSVPGVVSAGSGWVPLTWDAGGMGWSLGDPRESPSAEEIHTRAWQVGPGFFETLGVEVVAGRGFGRDEWEKALITRGDIRDNAGRAEGRPADAPLPVVVNETMAIRHWGGAERAVGSELWGGGWTTGGTPYPHRIIGVVRDIKGRVRETEAELGVYTVSGWRGFLVRTAIDPLAVAPEIRRAVEELDSVELSIPSFTTLEELVAAESTDERFRMRVLLLAAALALVLAAVGLFGVMVHSVSRRTHEIAVRMSLGARTTEVVGLVAGQSLRIVLVGVVIGLAGAVALARAMESLLFGVAPLDPVAFAVSAIVLTAVSALACYLPTLRAVAVDPVVALRSE
jgi:predicted permease